MACWPRSNRPRSPRSRPATRPRPAPGRGSGCRSAPSPPTPRSCPPGCCPSPCWNWPSPRGRARLRLPPPTLTSCRSSAPSPPRTASRQPSAGLPGSSATPSSTSPTSRSSQPSTATTKHPKQAQAFVRFLLSPTGQQILAHGYDFEYTTRPGIAPNPQLTPLAAIGPATLNPKTLGNDQLASQLIEES